MQAGSEQRQPEFFCTVYLSISNPWLADAEPAQVDEATSTRQPWTMAATPEDNNNNLKEGISPKLKTSGSQETTECF